jgi:hypothetical protein
MSIIILSNDKKYKAFAASGDIEVQRTKLVGDANKFSVDGTNIFAVDNIDCEGADPIEVIARMSKRDTLIYSTKAKAVAAIKSTIKSIIREKNE